MHFTSVRAKVGTRKQSCENECMQCNIYAFQLSEILGREGRCIASKRTNKNFTLCASALKRLKWGCQLSAIALPLDALPLRAATYCFLWHPSCQACIRGGAKAHRQHLLQPLLVGEVEVAHLRTVHARKDKQSQPGEHGPPSFTMPYPPSWLRLTCAAHSQVPPAQWPFGTHPVCVPL